MNWPSPDMYIIEPTLIHIVIQKILSKSGRTTIDSLKKSHSIKLRYLRIIVPRFEVDWIRTKGKIAPYDNDNNVCDAGPITILGRRFVFVGITTVNLVLKGST